MVSVEHSSNTIKLPQRSHNMVSVWVQLTETYQNFSSQADPAREKMDLKLSTFQ